MITARKDDFGDPAVKILDGWMRHGVTKDPLSKRGAMIVASSARLNQES
jgi:hypothetical protein